MNREFYDRGVVWVARDLVGCVLRHGETAGVIVETEAYHELEPACHAFVGLTPRTRILFGPPARAYVYRSYGIHALFNAVCEDEGVGAAVLIRALEPLEGLDVMRARRGLERPEDLCSRPRQADPGARHRARPQRLRPARRADLDRAAAAGLGVARAARRAARRHHQGGGAAVALLRRGLALGQPPWPRSHLNRVRPL